MSIHTTLQRIFQQKKTTAIVRPGQMRVITHQERSAQLSVAVDRLQKRNDDLRIALQVIATQTQDEIILRVIQLALEEK